MPLNDPAGYTPENLAGLLSMSMLAPPAGAAIAAPQLMEMMAGMGGQFTGPNVSFMGASQMAPQPVPVQGRRLADMTDIRELNRLYADPRVQSQDQRNRIGERIRQLQMQQIQR